MQTMREAWTDERLDDLNAKVDNGFDRVEASTRELRAEMSAGFVELRGQIAGLQRGMVFGWIGLASVMIALTSLIAAVQ